MNLEQLINQFDLVTDNEEGLEQLRNLILNLAFRGELTKQNTAEKSGEELLEQVRDEKQRMYDNGKIRKPKELSAIETEQMPYRLPQGWTWCRLGDTYHNWGNKTPDTDFQYIDVSSIDNEKGEIGNSVELISPEDAPSRAKRIVKKGTVLYSTVRPYLLNVAIYKGDFDYEPIASTAFEVIHPHTGVFNRYVYHYLRSPIFTKYVDSTMVGVAYPAVNKGDMIEGYFPLPPIEKQQRIVQKIETLFSQVDKLEQKVQQDREVDERLQVAVLDDLQSAETPQASKQSWQRLTDQFEQIYRKPEHIDQLKQAILNEAVRGRLVPQDPKDEPAEKLLEGIEEEKQQLYDDGEIRKLKDLDPIKEKEIRYELPNTWCWSKLGNLVIVEMGQSPPGDSYNKEGDGPPLINGPVEFGSNPFSKTHIEQYTTQPNKMCKKGDFLICVRGSTTGRTNIAGFDACIGRGVAALKPLFGDEFVRWCIVNFRDQIFDSGKGSTFPSISKTEIANLIIPLPPLNEQKRIVRKIVELFSWCDELKDKLNRSQKTDQRLLEALVNGNKK